MIRWRNVPWPVWAFAALTVADMISIEIEASGPLLAKAIVPALMSAYLFFLLRGVFWLWITTVGIVGTGLGGDLISGSMSWHALVVGLLSIGLLLLPVTRRYFEREPQSRPGTLRKSKLT